MSGSSLDGLDICYVEFLVYSPKSIDNSNSKNNINHRLSSIDYKIHKADCVEYDSVFRNRLQDAPGLSAFEFAKLHTEIGKYFGELTKDFIKKNEIEKVDLLASHGQTIFHQPGLGFTTQIGCGAQIAAQTNCKVVCDLRSSDVANGGQGAPIVPVAENYLFSDYKVFLNLGGIANIAFHNPKSLKGLSEIIAYDVCAANTLLNYFAGQKGLKYDYNGDLARNGNINNDLLAQLNAIDFCKQPSPKSLGSEHIFSDWIPLFSGYEISTEDKLATAVEHIAVQVGQSIVNSQWTIDNKNYRLSTIDNQILVSGGGALNSFLTERIQHHTTLKVVVPDFLTVQYKEALAMAFIGLLRILEIPNCLASVTGASKDTTDGAVYLP